MGQGPAPFLRANAQLGDPGAPCRRLTAKADRKRASLPVLRLPRIRRACRRDVRLQSYMNRGALAGKATAAANVNAGATRGIAANTPPPLFAFGSTTALTAAKR